MPCLCHADHTSGAAGGLNICAAARGMPTSGKSPEKSNLPAVTHSSMLRSLLLTLLLWHAAGILEPDETAALEGGFRAPLVVLFKARHT